MWVFEVETALWQVVAEKSGKWHRGVLEAGERFMVRVARHQAGQWVLETAYMTFVLRMLRMNGICCV